MTATRRDGNESAMSAWIRKHPELESNGCKLSVTDSDLWIHRFSERKENKRTETLDIRDVVDSIMLVEIKTFSAGMKFAQRDTLQVVDALLRKSGMVNGRRRPVRIDDARLAVRRQRYVRCFGVHFLQLSGDSPDNSADGIVWDGRHFLHESHLIELLLFERDPDHPTRGLDTRRHHVLKVKPTLSAFRNNLWKWA